MLQQFSLGIATVGTYRQIPAGLCVYSYIEDSYTVSYSTEIAIFLLVSMQLRIYLYSYKLNSVS